MLVREGWNIRGAHTRRQMRNDAGSTMVTVLIVMLVLTIGGMALSSLAIRTAGTVTDTRHRSAAQAEVDGAIATQSVELMEGRLLCDTSHQQSGTVYNGTGTVPVNWTLDCSESGTVGTATIQARSNVSGEQALRKAVFNYDVAPTTVPNYGGPDDPIMFFGDGETSFNSNNLIPASGGSIDVSIPKGSFTCNTKFPGDLVVNGSITVQGGCEVKGNMISVTGSVKGPALKVGGDLVAYQSVELTSSSEIAGSLYSFTGELKLTSNSRVLGSVQTQGNIDLNGSGIGGNASMVNGSLTTGWGTSAITAGVAQNKVNGTVLAGGSGNNSIPGEVGSIHANGSIDFTTSDKAIPGSVTANGNVLLRNTKVAGTLTLPASRTLTKEAWENGSYGSLLQPTHVDPPSIPDMPTMPTMPDWFEYSFDAADWPGYTVKTLVNSASSGSADPLQCSHYNKNNGGVNDNSPGKPNGWSTIKDLTGPTIIDARACDTLTTNMGLSPVVELNHNVVLLAKAFDLTNSTFKAAAGASTDPKPGLWILKEDPNPGDGLPSCSPAGDTKLNNTRVEASIRAMVYTPCTIEVNAGSVLNGQLYGKNWAGGGGAGITFTADSIGVPGMDGTAPSAGGGGTGSGAGIPVAGSFVLRTSQDVAIQ